MPELRSVYFAPDGKYFNTYDECKEYEKKIDFIIYMKVELPDYDVDVDWTVIYTTLTKQYEIYEK